MKQVLQNRKSGKVAVGEVPVPVVQPGRVLVRTVASLISAGTEKASVENARKSLVQEARERPDLVKAVIDKARNEGLINTFNAVRGKLAASQGLGYSASGIVMAVGNDVTEFAPGDRVACAGVGFASHAEVLSVPKNLCVRLPEEVSFESGAFGTLGAIALQGVRLAEPTLGESFVVIGLGLVGQLTVQLLKANGCNVFGIDLDSARVELARKMGADAGAVSNDQTKSLVLDWTQGRGADAVLITAATDSNQPIELAGEVSRMKGRVVVVGMTGLSVPRPTYFSRELSLKISMSYGPGRYDPGYEERGNDYPFGYVRWTENRNIEAFLNLVGQERVKLEPLITHRFEIDNAERAYELLSGTAKEPYLGVLLRYDPERELNRTVTLAEAARRGAAREKSVRIGVIGAGGYVPAMLLPHFKSAGAEFISVATASGVTAVDVGNKFGFRRAVSGWEEVIDDPDVNLVVIGTRHDLHATLVRQALERDKHVFVEKPLALNDEELSQVMDAASKSRGQLMVGFNRRFSPLARKAREFFADRSGPLSILYRVNAGRIPPEHWTYDPVQGGGRIVGEACHFVDLMQFWIGAPPVSVFAEGVTSNRHDVVNHDSVFITLHFADGSNGCVAYLAAGDKALAKERIEIFGDGKSFVLDDFLHATAYRGGREEKFTLRAQDKGQAEEVNAVCAAVLNSGPAPIPVEELFATTRATFRALDSLRTGSRIELSSSEFNL
ncbi:MAG: bi-domain-containing oxidoreductase [Acidobacteriota bacterium]|nr:bi-domain-containing oxidoreductase [Acidobacteriota bacterium]